MTKRILAAAILGSVALGGAACDTNPNDSVKACIKLINCGVCIRDSSGYCAELGDCAYADVDSTTLACITKATECTAIVGCQSAAVADAVTNDVVADVATGTCQAACEKVINCGYCYNDGNGGCSTVDLCTTATCTSTFQSCAMNAGDCATAKACAGTTSGG